MYTVLVNSMHGAYEVSVKYHAIVLLCKYATATLVYLSSVCCVSLCNYPASLTR